MKTFRVFSFAVCLMAIANLSFAQSVTETFDVSGNCGMCENKIEKAAKDAGATAAEWDVDTKKLTVTFNSSSTNLAKIQKKIAKVGYDNAGATASQESYDKLHGCCKYERTGTNEAKVTSCKDGNCDGCENCKECCKDGKCTDGKCCKDGKCAHAQMKKADTHEAKVACCKDGNCAGCEDCKDCCKDGKCTDGNCCKDGKCTNCKEGKACKAEGCSKNEEGCCKKA